MLRLPVQSRDPTELRVATPLGLSCTLPPSCFTFFSPLLVSFVSRLGLVRLGSALLGPRTALPLLPPFSIQSPLVVPLSRDRLQPLAPLAGPYGYQPLVFTSDQVGGDPDKTTSKLKYSPATLRPARRHVSSIAKEREGRRTLREHTWNARGSLLHVEKLQARNEGPPRRQRGRRRKRGSRRARTRGFVKTKPQSFVESRRV